MSRGHFGVCLLCIVLINLDAHAERGAGGADTPPSAESQGWAIVIGAGDYADPSIGDLPNAVHDAKALRDALASMQDRFPAKNVIMLADGAGPDLAPTRANILRYVTSYLALAGPEDTVLLYFAGHGVTEQGQLYLLPSDASSVDVAFTGFPFAQIERLLREAGALKKVLILDACHSGTGRAAPEMSRDAVAELERAASGMVTLASCSESELSHEMPETGHGAFTYFLLQALQGKADRDGDQLISASEAIHYTWDETRRWAAGQGFKQTPWRREEGAGEIILGRSAKPGPTAPEWALSEKLNELRFGDYVLTIEQPDRKEDTLVIVKAGVVQERIELNWISSFLTVIDVTGDTYPEAVVESFSGGAHCCFDYLILDMRDGVRPLARIDAGNGDAKFEDTDGDGVTELLTVDNTFAYWEECFAGSPLMHVVLTWKEGAFHLDDAVMRRNGPAIAEVQEALPGVREAFTTNTGIAGHQDAAWAPVPSDLWRMMLRLIYAGRAPEARGFFDAAWPEGKSGKSVFYAAFMETLREGSPYYKDLVLLNGRQL